MIGCPDCKAAGGTCKWCAAEDARIDRNANAKAVADATADDADWIEHKEVCSLCRRGAQDRVGRAALRAKCPWWAKWGGPLPSGMEVRR